MDLENDHLVKSFIQNRNLRKGTIALYLQNIRNYSNFLGKTPTEWINEAEYEEDQRIRMRNRKIKQYLLDFKDYLTENNYSPGLSQQF